MQNSKLCLALGLAVYALTSTAADPDLWGHVKFGQDLWTSRQIVRPDSYSYLTGDQLWINHEWLAEMIFFLIFAVAGPAGLIAFKTGVALLILGLVARHLGRLGVGEAAVLIALLRLLSFGLLTVRPQLFTYLCLLLLLLLLYRAEHGATRWLWGAPPLFALWVNLHGGVLAGLGVLLLWFSVHIVRRGWRGADVQPGRRVEVALAVGLSVLATLVNPYGIRLLFFLLRTATVPRPEIAEWRSIDIVRVDGGIYLIVVALTLAALASSRRPRRPAFMVLLAVTAVLPLIASRHTPLFGLAVSVLAGEHIVDLWKRWSADRLSPDRAPWKSALRPWLAGASLLGAAVLLTASIPKFRCIWTDPKLSPAFPARAVALLQHSGVRGNLAIHFDWGEYALWHLGDRIKISVDGRRETIYSPKIYDENLHFMLGTGEWDALISKHDTHLVLVSKSFAAFNLMKLVSDWRLVYEDAVSGLFVRERSPLIDQIQRTPIPAVPDDGDGLCFPGTESSKKGRV